MATTKVQPLPWKEVGIGMLGCGFMGKCHTNAFKKIPYIYPEARIMPRFVLMCGRRADVAQQQAARFGYEECCTDWHDLVADNRVQVVDNCGPDPVHPEPCIAALEQGKHVICEKPLAIAAADARRMRDAAAKAKTKAACTFNYRFMPAVRLAKDLISAGQLGTVYQMRVHYLQMAGHDPTVPPAKLWYAAWPSSGGLQGLGSHAIDQCRYLVGEIKSVSALVRTFTKERAQPSAACSESVLADEGTAAVLEFHNGTIGVLESSVVATGRKNFLSWEINGSKGSLRWDLEHPNSLFACLEGSQGGPLLGFTEISVTERSHPYVSPWWPHGHNLGWEHGHIIEKFLFLDAVVNNQPLSPHLATFEDGYRVAAIIEAMRRSSSTGQREELTF